MKLPDVLYGTFEVIVVDKSGTDRRNNKGMVNVFTIAIDITSRQ